MAPARLTPGRLVYLTFHLPVSLIRRSWRAGGPWQQWLTARGRIAMERAAPGLPPVCCPPRQAEEPELVFLTGRNLWYQTAFCLHSFCRQSALRPAVRFVSDGTLGPAEAGILQQLFPGSTFEAEDIVSHRLAQRLPDARFPALRGHERQLVLIRKLTHVHGAGSGWQLFLDSDMIFHARPRLLEEWLAVPDRPVFMTDVQNAYGYPLAVLDALAGTRVPERLNTGVSGLHAATIDWPAIERALASLVAAHGTSYYMEQALFAIHLAGRDFLRLPAADYVVAPTTVQAVAANVPLHHYVDLSKRDYFRHAWRRFAR